MTKFLEVVVFLLSKFKVSTITGSGVKTIFIYNGFDKKCRNLKPHLACVSLIHIK